MPARRAYRVVRGRQISPEFFAHIPPRDTRAHAMLLAWGGRTYFLFASSTRSLHRHRVTGWPNPHPSEAPASPGDLGEAPGRSSCLHAGPNQGARFRPRNRGTSSETDSRFQNWCPGIWSLFRPPFRAPFLVCEARPVGSGTVAGVPQDSRPPSHCDPNPALVVLCVACSTEKFARMRTHRKHPCQKTRSKGVHVVHPCRC